MYGATQMQLHSGVRVLSKVLEGYVAENHSQ